MQAQSISMIKDFFLFSYDIIIKFKIFIMSKIFNGLEGFFFNERYPRYKRKLFQMNYYYNHTKLKKTDTLY